MYFSQQTSHFSSNRASLITLNYFLWLSPLDGRLTSFSGRHSNNQCNIKTNRPWRRQLETVNTRCRSLVRHQLFLVEPHFSNFFWVPFFGDLDWNNELYVLFSDLVWRSGPVQQAISQEFRRFRDMDLYNNLQVKGPYDSEKMTWISLYRSRVPTPERVSHLSALLAQRYCTCQHLNWPSPLTEISRGPT